MAIKLSKNWISGICSPRRISCSQCGTLDQKMKSMKYKHIDIQKNILKRPVGEIFKRVKQSFIFCDFNGQTTECHRAVDVWEFNILNSLKEKQFTRYSLLKYNLMILNIQTVDRFLFYSSGSTSCTMCQIQSTVRQQRLCVTQDAAPVILTSCAWAAVVQSFGV